MKKEVVTFPANTPVEVSLLSDRGTPVQGRYGGQVLYSLADERVMYVPPYVDRRLQELAIAPGEPVILCKKQTETDAGHKRTEWSIRRAPQVPVALDLGELCDGPANQACAKKGVTAAVGAEVGESLVERSGETEEQPSGNSTAPMVQQSRDERVDLHQPQDNVEQVQHAVVLPPARVDSTWAEDNVYLPAMSMEVALARRSAIIEFARRIMVKDQDFGEIPGASKPTLLKPGAEKLCNFFWLEPEFTPVAEEVDWTGAQHGGEPFCYARYRCRLVRNGRIVGAGEGSCNSWESKYRYRWVAEDQIPKGIDVSNLPKRDGRRTLSEFEFAIDRAETTGPYGKPAEHWQKFRDAIRNGTARPVEKSTKRGTAIAWELQEGTTQYRVPAADAADLVNTIQKMAQKRALIAATLIAVSASEFFTQDVEDSSPGLHPAEAVSVEGSKTSREPSSDLNGRRPRYQPSGRSDTGSIGKPWATFGEMRQAFARVREQVGETQYFEELDRAGVQDPGQFRSAAAALQCYRSLTRLAETAEVV